MADGLLVLSCYEKLKAVGEACQTLHFPNVRVVSISIANKDETKNFGLLERMAEKYVLLAEFNVELYHTVSAFKAARIICPVFVQWLSLSDGRVKALKISPFLNNDANIDALLKRATAVGRGRSRRGRFIEREDGGMVEASRKTTV